MSFNSLNRILEAIEQQPAWAAYQEYRHLLQVWAAIASPQVAENTRPLYICRQVLWVATASSAWAQTLSFQRSTLLKQLNAQLPEPLKDIRFSPAHWPVRQPATAAEDAMPTALQQHPSSIEGLAEQDLPELPAANSPATAFQRWAAVIRWRSQNLPLCPNCQCPTPPGELARWTVCGPCAAQQWAGSHFTKS